MSASDKDTAIEFTNVSKFYHTYPTPQHRLLELMARGKKRYSRETRALDNVSFSLKKGGRLGIVGENGSGKSTLLKVLAGVLTPTSGTVKVRGRVSALLELGAGFNPEISGEENIRQFCMLHRMHGSEVEKALPEIIDFSELREVIEHPVKTYSSGMAVRLGFACAVYVQPDILIVDEALSVGDTYFQNKCLQKIRSMLDQGVSFIYVTHAADAIRSLCEEGLWLDHGKVQLAGSSALVGAAYQSAVFSRMVRTGLPEEGIAAGAGTPQASPGKSAQFVVDKLRSRAFKDRVEPLRTGSGEIRISDINIIDAEGCETDSIPFASKTIVRIFYRVESELLEEASMTLGITDKSGNQILHFNSSLQGIYASAAPLHIPQVIEFAFINPLCPGEYGIMAGITLLQKHASEPYRTIIDTVVDYCAGGTRFSVNAPIDEIDRDLWGVVHVDYDVRKLSLD